MAGKRVQEGGHSESQSRAGVMRPPAGVTVAPGMKSCYTGQEISIEENSQQQVNKISEVTI